ncbi:MAG: site-2 protease family protein [Phycisphaerales bacterium]|nr:site-2 protease family protein [Phycisphaerales bacterium]
MSWWVHDVFQTQGLPYLLSWIFWMLLSITLHELAHGWAAIWEGDFTPIETGHMSANPVVHMGGFSLIVFALIGFAWGLMPVRPWNFRHRRWGEAIVAFAGPAMNLALAFVSLTALGIWRGIDPTLQTAPSAEWMVHTSNFLWLGGWLNLVLFALNLIPVPPLDGSRILAATSMQIRQLYNHPNASMAGMIVFFLILMTNIFNVALVGIGMASQQYTDIIAAAVGGSG